MSYIAAALFFTAALLAAAVTLHMLVKLHWAEILLALKGELGLEVRTPDRSSPLAARSRPRPRAAA
ncbi:MAG TPA: hypothetical protein VIT45_10950 [Allosphingosinicella sp.]